MVISIGLEPMPPILKGWYSSHLSYEIIKYLYIKKQNYINFLNYPINNVNIISCESRARAYDLQIDCDHK